MPGNCPADSYPAHAIYKNGVFKEQLFPFDAIPRVVSAKDFSSMGKGLIQRVDALNLFLKDIYSEGKL